MDRDDKEKNGNNLNVLSHSLDYVNCNNNDNNPCVISIFSAMYPYTITPYFFFTLFPLYPYSLYTLISPIPPLFPLYPIPPIPLFPLYPYPYTPNILASERKRKNHKSYQPG